MSTAHSPGAATAWCRLVHPTSEPAPGGWAAFVAREGLRPFWEFELLAEAARHANERTVCAVLGLGPDVIGLAHLRTPPRPAAAWLARLPQGPPGRRARVAPLLAAHGVPVSMGVGLALADALSPAQRARAVNTLHRTLRRHLGTLAVLLVDASDADCDALGARRLRPVSEHFELALPWRGYADYLRDLSRKKWRWTLRTIRKSTDRLDVRICAGPLPDGAPDLVRAVAEAHATGPGPRNGLSDSYLELLARMPGALHLTYRDDAGQLLAYCLGLRHGHRLQVVAWGRVPPSRGGPRDLYFDMWSRWIEWAIDAGLEAVDLGKGMPEVKRKYEALGRPRWLALSW